MRVLKEPEENTKIPTMEVSCTGIGFLTRDVEGYSKHLL